MSIQENEREIASMPLRDVRRLQQLLAARPATETGGDGESTEPEAEADLTVFDLVEHLISRGTGEATPDLSSNKAYLSDLGANSLR